MWWPNFVPILQIRKVKLRRVGKFAPGHRNSEGRKRNLTAKSVYFYVVLLPSQEKVAITDLELCVMRQGQGRVRVWSEGSLLPSWSGWLYSLVTA